MIVSQKPAYWITVRDCFFCFLQEEIGVSRLYEQYIYQAPVVKSIGLTATIASGDIYASGLVYDSMRQTQGAEIALGAVALDHTIVDKAIGVLKDSGYVFDSSTDIAKEFAFGYYLDDSKGNHIYYWHPRCILSDNDEAVETSTDSAADPNKSYTIKSLPTSEGIWRVRYYTDDADDPLTPAEFFGAVRYTDQIQLAAVKVASAVVGSASSATVEYIGGTPSSPELSYAWYIADAEDGDYAAISGATSSSYTPASGDADKYIKCRVSVSGDDVIGVAESDPIKVAEE